MEMGSRRPQREGTLHCGSVIAGGFPDGERVSVHTRQENAGRAGLHPCGGAGITARPGRERSPPGRSPHTYLLSSTLPSFPLQFSLPGTRLLPRKLLVSLPNLCSFPSHPAQACMPRRFPQYPGPPSPLHAGLNVLVELVAHPSPACPCVPQGQHPVLFTSISSLLARGSPQDALSWVKILKNTLARHVPLKPSMGPCLTGNTEHCGLGKCSLSRTFQVVGNKADHMSTPGESYPIILEALSGSREVRRRLETCLYQISTCWSVQNSAGSNLNFPESSWPRTLRLGQECGQQSQDPFHRSMRAPSELRELQAQ